MKIRSIRPAPQAPSPKGFCTLARFNIQITDDVMVCDCTLVRAPDGRTILYGPGRDGNSLSCSPATRRLIVEMALAALGMKNDSAAAA
jgi:hypothetical protein